MKDLRRVSGNMVKGGKGVSTPPSARHFQSSSSCFAFLIVLQNRLKSSLETKGRERTRRLKEDLENELSKWGEKLILFHFVY